MDNFFDDNGAFFSEDKKHRFALWRIWDRSKPLVMFIGLNPSTANETSDDPTIRRVKSLSNKWGYGGVYMMNLFSFVTPYPSKLEVHTNSISHNDWWIKGIYLKCDKVIFAWGAFEEAKERGKIMAELFKEPYCLHINKDGSPKHPLYVKSDIIPKLYKK